ncbi:MAG: AEC family transporter [Burkholderiaceae bacterium]|nr:AEC family transporter [Burkholderiaceae bacterium]
MLQILAITTPIYLIIALGFASVRQGVFTREHMGVLGQFLLRISLPCLVFRAISQYRLGEVLNTDYLGVYVLASLLTWLAGVALARKLCGHDRTRSALYGQGMSNSNSVFIGYPIVQPLLGPAADIALALCLLTEIALIIPLTMAVADSGSHLSWRDSLRQSLRALFKSPVFLSILAGLGGSALGLDLAPPLQKTLALLSSAAAPVALFMIGGMLVGQPLAGWGKELSALALGKLLLHPLATLLLLRLMPRFDPQLQTAALMFACMPIPVLLPTLAQKYGLGGFCSAALVLSTVLSFLTLNSWLAAMPWLMQWVQK